MKILSIETSCDETAVSIIEATGDFPEATYTVLGNALYSQTDMHREYGGVYPAVAKREHARTLPLMLYKALAEAELLDESTTDIPESTIKEIQVLLEREPGLSEQLIEFVSKYERPEVDVIAVTSGPGLEPALWVGINFAHALALIWNIVVVPVNHMEGHILASIYNVVEDDVLAPVAFPAIALLISGGHTELILMKGWNQYEKIGETRDDAVGEAFDKVARMMGLPYPGGPEIGKRAAEARAKNLPPYKDDLPLPMLHSGDLDFSFSGLKTAVRYAIADKELDETDVTALSRDFEDIVAKVLIKKTHSAIEQYGAQTLIIGGGVSANTYLRQQFQTHFLASHPDMEVYVPPPKMSTDNSIMIALSGHAHYASALSPQGAGAIRANGNKTLHNS